MTCVSGWSLPSGAAPAGQREIGRFLGQGGFEFEFGAALGQRGLQFDLAALTALPAAGFSSLGRVPSCFISAVNLPFEPR